ncbi:MAG: hypothetical protein WA754_17610, partial [Pseudolabrys sp.]
PNHCASLGDSATSSTRIRFSVHTGNVTQPQGKTGPLNTKSGGAPASSPQGETPPGMQSAPKGSDKTIRTDGNDVPEGTPKE